MPMVEGGFLVETTVEDSLIRASVLAVHVECDPGGDFEAPMERTLFLIAHEGRFHWVPAHRCSAPPSRA